MEKTYKKCQVCGRLKWRFSKENKNICAYCKRVQTMLRKYGVENNSQLQTNKDKIRETRQNQSKAYKENKQNKVRKTILEKYGVDNYFKRTDLVKKDWLEKYGVDNPSKNKSIRQKQKDTCLRKYGNTIYANTEKGQENRKQKYNYDNQNFDSKPELAFYIYCKDFNSNIKRNTKSFEYIFENKKHYYFPDFEVDNQLYEIKGSQFLAEDGTWQNPFCEKDKDYFEAKHQCALTNNVKILYTEDYQKYLDYIDENYGKGYLNQFRSIKESTKKDDN